MRQENLCPDCGKPFSLGSALRAHIKEEHEHASDHEMPAEMLWLLGSAVESGGWDD